MSPILEDNPDFKSSIIRFAQDNLQVLTSEFLHSKVIEQFLPNLVKKINDDDATAADVSIDEVLKKYNLKIISLRTIQRWMSQLGFTYKLRKKCYYVDNHERADIVLYRDKFVIRYLEYELRTYRWIQLKEEEVLEYELNKELKREDGYKYSHEDGSTWYEYHVDDHTDFESRMNEGYHPFGGNLSVRKPPDSKPLMILGQDEVIFKQYLMNSRVWTAPDGTTPLVPKDDGKSLMISGFQQSTIAKTQQVHSQNTQAAGQSY